jgi:hypothetical protein
MENVVNVWRITKEAGNFPHASFLNRSKGPMIEALERLLPTEAAENNACESIKAAISGPAPNFLNFL